MRTRKWIIFLLLFSLVLVNEPFICYAASQFDEVGIFSSVKQVDDDSEIVTKQYFDANCNIELELTDRWSGGYNLKVTIQNIDSEPIRGWLCELEGFSKPEYIWNAEICECENDKVSFSHLDWNGYIDAGSSVSFGGSFNGSFLSWPQKVKLHKSELMPCDDICISVNIESTWNNGGMGCIVIRNSTDHKIFDWVLDLDSEVALGNIWNGRLISKVNNNYRIESVNENRIIAANETVTIGFVYSGVLQVNSINNLCMSEYSFSQNNIENNIEENNDINSDDNSYESISTQTADNIVSIQDDELGVIYYKNPTENDISVDEVTGIKYIKDQLLVSVNHYTKREVMESVFQDIGADIVGYIELTNDYQIEFKEKKTYEELLEGIVQISSLPEIEYVSLNLHENAMTYWTGDYNNNDLLYNDCIIAAKHGLETIYKDFNEGEIDANSSIGDNWPLKDLNIPSAWTLIDDQKQTVRVGIYDAGFATENHEDFSNVTMVNNPMKIDEELKNHGTMVAGIIGATHNDLGIAGIANDAEIYAYTYENVSSSMGDKVAIASLVGKHVRVINFSMGYVDEMVYAIQQGNSKLVNMREQQKNIYTEFLLKLYNMGYDFTLVTAAGNANHKKYSYDNNYYGYVVDDINGIMVDDILASNASPFNAITNEFLRDRIIVVAAVSAERTYMPANRIYSGNCIGERVDVYAPGVDVLSTVSVGAKHTQIAGYRMDTGTSCAAPHISGIAALLYEVNPLLSSEQVKRIICCDENKKTDFFDVNGIVRNLPDALKCVQMAMNTQGENNEELVENNGLIFGVISHDDKEKGNSTEIILLGENALKKYMFSADESGEYFISIPEGTYKMIVKRKGFLNYLIDDLVIKNGEIIDMGNIFLMKRYFYIKGTIVNSLNGTEISNASIRLIEGINRKDDFGDNNTEEIIQAYSDNAGNYEIYIPYGVYTVEVSKEGFAPKYENIFIDNDELEEMEVYRTFELDKNEELYYIMLSWENAPVDLDIGISCITNAETLWRGTTKNHDNYHFNESIRFGDDDKEGAGKEDVFIYGFENLGEETELSFCVIDNGCKSGSMSGAIHGIGVNVYVYKGDNLIKTYVAPKDAIRRVWHVFNITNEGIKDINRITDMIP